MNSFLDRENEMSITNCLLFASCALFVGVVVQVHGCSMLRYSGSALAAYLSWSPVLFEFSESPNLFPGIWEGKALRFP